MEFQNLKAADNAAIRDLFSNPFSEVCCPRCGKRMKFIVMAKLETIGNVYDIVCSNTPRCFFYPIPAPLTPECIRWQEPDKVKPEEISFDHYCSSCRVLKYCAVDRGKEAQE